MNAPVKQQAKQPQPKRFTLSSVKKGKEAKPFTVLLYGTEGIGKSTWAADAPNPIFVPTEDGTDHIDVTRFPKCKSWKDLPECLDTLLDEDHVFKTCVIDTVDAAERLTFAHVISTRKTDRGEKAESIEDFGFGKGYVMAAEAWTMLLSKLDRLRDKGMNVILLAHSHVKSFTNPEGANFDRYELKMNAKISGLLKEWPYAVLFANYEIYATTAKGEKKAKGVGTGARIVKTEKRPAFDAKNRYGLPFEMPLSFGEFFDYASGTSVSVTAQSLREKLVALSAGTEFERATLRGIEKAGDDTQQLATALNWLTAKVNGESNND